MIRRENGSERAKGGVKTVLFACVHNAGRSPMAAAFFNSLADAAAARAISAGTEPAASVHPEVVAVMREAGLDLSGQRPRRLTPALAGSADMLITLGCGESCPVLPGVAREDWPVPDPRGGSPEAVRAIRDVLRKRVLALLDSKGWLAGGTGRTADPSRYG